MPQIGRLEQAVQILNVCRIEIAETKRKIESERDSVKLRDLHEGLLALYTIRDMILSDLQNPFFENIFRQ